MLAGGTLNQDIEEPFATNHKDTSHQVQGELGSGLVHSHHHQALTDAGNLSVVAQSEDGLIEAVQDCSRPWYVGVQWHPERTENEVLGQKLFDQLVKATRPVGITST